MKRANVQMKRAVALAALAVGIAVLALPSSAMAESDCAYTASQDQRVPVGPVTVYADTAGSNGGVTGTAAVAAGACADGLGAGGLDGGFVEVGAGEDPGTGAADPGLVANQPDGYAVVDGSDANSEPSQQSDGYVGVSNYETGGSRTSQAACQSSPPTGGPDNGAPGSSNSGGCVGVDGVGSVYVPGDAPTPVCGNSSGNAWSGNNGGLVPGSPNQRDGCSIP